MITYKGLSTYNKYKKFRLTDFELAKQDLFNHFNIRKGEKLMNPNFGTIIWDVLFEPFTEHVRRTIISDITSIAESDTRILINNVLVDEYEYGIQLELELIYIPTNQVDTMIVNFNQQNKTATIV
jgi:phage baseplate assembly protein W